MGPLRGGRLRSAVSAREVAPADFGKRQRPLAQPGVGSVRYLCGVGSWPAGGVMTGMNCPIMRGEAAAVPGAGWLSDAPRGVAGPRLPLPSPVPGGKCL